MPQGRPVHEFAMPPCAELDPGQGLVVITASAGSLKPMSDILSTLPQDFPAAVAVVQHRGEQSPELLPAILASAQLPVRHARNGDYLKPGTVYVIPPGVHMTVERSLRLVAAPRLEHVRPNANLMLRSAADAYGRQAVGVVLSGIGRERRRDAGPSARRAGRSSPRTRVLGIPGHACGRDQSGRCEPRAPAEGIARRSRRAGGTPGGRGPELLCPSPVTACSWPMTTGSSARACVPYSRAMKTLTSWPRRRTGGPRYGWRRSISPDVMVMDVAMPDLDGITATRQIVAPGPGQIVALSALSDTGAVRRMLDAGAVGYLPKNGAFEELAPPSGRSSAARSISARTSRAGSCPANCNATLPGPPVDGAGRRAAIAPRPPQTGGSVMDTQIMPNPAQTIAAAELSTLHWPPAGSRAWTRSSGAASPGTTCTSSQGTAGTGKTTLGLQFFGPAPGRRAGPVHHPVAVARRDWRVSSGRTAGGSTGSPSTSCPPPGSSGRRNPQTVLHTADVELGESPTASARSSSGSGPAGLSSTHSARSASGRQPHRFQAEIVALCQLLDRRMGARPCS